MDVTLAEDALETGKIWPAGGSILVLPGNWCSLFGTSGGKILPGIGAPEAGDATFQVEIWDFSWFAFDLRPLAWLWLSFGHYVLPSERMHYINQNEKRK